MGIKSKLNNQPTFTMMNKLQLPAVFQLDQDEDVQTCRDSHRQFDTLTESDSFSDDISDFSGAAAYSMSPEQIAHIEHKVALLKGGLERQANKIENGIDTCDETIKTCEQGINRIDVHNKFAVREPTAMFRKIGQAAAEPQTLQQDVKAAKKAKRSRSGVFARLASGETESQKARRSMQDPSIAEQLQNFF